MSSAPFPAFLLKTQTTQIDNADGTVVQCRAGHKQELLVSDAEARYLDAVRRGGVFYATNSAAQALSTNSTTATGIILYNPAGSGKNVVLLEAMVALQSLPAGVSVALLTGGAQAAAPTGTATTNVANGIVNAFVGGNNRQASVCSVFSAATIATAAIQRILPLATAATVAASTSFPPFAKDEIAGSLVIAPGNVVSLQCLTTAITVLAQLTWEEVAV